MTWKSAWAPYITNAQRRRRAASAAAKITGGTEELNPIHVETKGGHLARTFWGKAWCKNLESYSDYANRLPRGRSYLRSGSVLDLKIGKGVVNALVSGTSIYKVKIRIAPLLPARWETLKRECAGQVHSLLDLLQGRLSESVMERVSCRQDGLFPSPDEIDLSCSCPDWASMCKHVAATLYGVGVRLDKSPELLFLLRGVEPTELISKAAEMVAQPSAESAPLAESELADVFGIDIAAAPTTVPQPPSFAPVSFSTAQPPAKAESTVVSKKQAVTSVRPGKQAASRKLPKRVDRSLAPQGKSLPAKRQTPTAPKKRPVAKKGSARKKKSAYDLIFGS